MKLRNSAYVTGFYLIFYATITMCHRMGKDDIASFLGQNLPGCEHLGTGEDGTGPGVAQLTGMPPPPPPPPPPMPLQSQPPRPQPGSDQVHVDVAMEQDAKHTVGYLMQQCREARLASQKVQVTTVVRSEAGIVYNTDTVGCDTLGGGLDDDNTMNMKFHGARMNRGAIETNECMSSSFDPLNLACLMCDREHSILDSNRPLIIILTDQCFVGNLSGGETNCISVVKLENSTVLELADLALEIFDGKQIPAGSVIMIGSGSHLHRLGASSYAWDWVQCTNKIASKWRSVNVCPLIPIVTGDCPGSFHREVGQLAVWLSQVYTCSTRGLADTWAALVRTLDVRMQGGSQLLCMDTVRIPMPADLEGCTTRTYVFKYNSSCPAKLLSLDCKATEELVRALIQTLNRDFSTRLDPEAILERKTEQCPDAKHPPNVVVFGASNMSKVVHGIRSAGIEVTDLTVPGWVITPAALDQLGRRLMEVKNPGSIFVLELFSNSTIRFEQIDGTKSLPVKIGPQYHLPGGVSVTEDTVFKKTVTSSIPVLKLADGAKILIPPLPRYLSTPCCQNKEHCTNLRDPGYGTDQLDKLTLLRDCLKSTIITAGIPNVRILDGIGALGGIAPPNSRPGNAAFLGSVSKCLCRDGVHFTEEGTANMSRAIVATLRENWTKDTASVIFPGSRTRSGTFYWRGFTSPVGSKDRARSATKVKTGYTKSARKTPYKKRN